MFKRIESIDDLRPAVEHKEEIKFHKQPNGITMSMYLFMDSKTFDSPEAIECRGAAFDEKGRIVSRPLHKFFNVGEKDYLAPEKLLARDDIVGIYPKLDGSMIATAWVNGDLAWRSKKSFTSDVVRLTKEFLSDPAHRDVAPAIEEFAFWCAFHGMTAIFELTHPQAQIVVPQDVPRMRLLHVRDNVTGEYVLLNAAHMVQDMVDELDVPQVERLDMTLQEAIDSLEVMEYNEGYVVQFANGDMVKMKCPWYTRLHRSVTFMRERDIAMLAVNEELDDMKRHMVEVGLNLEKVNEVESRLKETLLEIEREITQVVEQDKGLERKDFAIKNGKHPRFGLIMGRYLGQDVDLRSWYVKSGQLKADFGLKSLLEGAQAEAVEG